MGIFRAISLKTRLAAIITLILFTGFLSVNLINYYSAKQAMKENIIYGSLPLTRDNIYSEIQRDLMRPVFVSSLMAHDTFLKDWVMGGERDEANIVKYLNEIKNKYGFFTSFFVSETTGKYYYFDGVLKIIRKDDPHDVWYYDFKDLHQDYDITVDTNEAAQSTLTVFINHRLNDYDNNFLGVTGVGLELQRIINLLNVYQVKYNRDIYLVDRLGIIEAHPGGRMLGSNIYKEEGLADIAMDAMSVSEVSGFYEFDRDGDHILLTVRYIPELDWFLFVEHNQSQSLEDVRKNLWQNMLLGLIVSIIIIFINILTVNFFQGRLEKLATTDELTGAMNRRAFGKAFADAVYFSERSGTAFSLIIFDVDCFKEVNDTLGHLTGDIILKRVLAAARENIRQVDTIARWGGDEFIVLAHGGEEISTAIAERIRTGVESIDFSDCVAEGRTLQVSISCGVTEHKEGETAEDAVRRADKALYEAKNAGRNKVVFNTSL